MNLFTISTAELVVVNAIAVHPTDPIPSSLINCTSDRQTAFRISGSFTSVHQTDGSNFGHQFFSSLN